MDYHLTIDLSDAELGALDAALHHERQRLNNRILYNAGRDNVIGMIHRDIRAINKLIDTLDQLITEE